MIHIYTVFIIMGFCTLTYSERFEIKLSTLGLFPYLGLRRGDWIVCTDSLENVFDQN